MASTSTQRVELPEQKPVERTAEPRPVQRPVEKPWTIKMDGSVPC
jgi:hypothetical protein